MSLMHLLAVGHSFLGMKTQPHRYKLCEQKFLPKFTSVPRPASPPSASMPEKDALRPDAEPLFHEKAALNPPASPSKVIPALKPGGARAIVASELPLDAAKASQATRKSVWKFFGAWPSPSKATRTFVQSELSLDQVKVMRNDLNDADLEIVRAQSAQQAAQPASQPAREARVLPGLAPARETRALPSFAPARETRALPSFAQPVQPEAARHALVMSDAELKPAAGRVWSRLTAQLFEADGQQL